VKTKKAEDKTPQMDDMVKKRDYTGAVALLEFMKHSDDAEKDTLAWIGYCAFHMGDYKKALEAYEEWESRGQAPDEVHLYKACCLFYLQMFKVAEQEASKGPANLLQNR
jgi:intraflagellar transport protein 56